MAEHNGEQGKFRRLKGKTVFIRSKDSVVTKGPEKGKRLIMKGTISSEGLRDNGDFDATPMLTNKKKKQKKECSCGEHAISKSVSENLDTIIGHMESLLNTEEGS